MSQRPSGLKAPTKIGRLSTGPKTGIQPPGSKAQIPAVIVTPPQTDDYHSSDHHDALEKSARAAGMSTHNAEKYAHHTMPRLPGPESSVSPSPPPDDFRIGERIWVSGTKPGIIAFIGETQFAPGEWAGVVLDEAIGKNDGSVAGVRYFQCEAKRGVFSRVTKLSKTPDLGALKAAGVMPKPSSSGGTHSNTSVLDSSVLGGPPSAPLAASTPAKVTHTDTTGSGENAPPHPVSSTPASHPKMGSMPKSSGLAKPANSYGSQTNLARGSLGSGGSQTNLAGEGGAKHQLRVGDRVLVSGSKAGTLRYIGPTDFAPGEWAGVELDDQQGKNDGAVAGKRYFDCRPQFGIFAKVSKVTKAASGPGLSSLQTPRRTSTGGSGARFVGLTGLTRDRSGSQDSISSIGSSVSTSSRSRVRLGVTSLNDSNTNTKKTAKTSTTSRHKAPTLASTNTALQKTLKEKEEHIDQLLQERDIERSELARASAKCDHAETELSSLRAEHERVLREQDEGAAALQTRVHKLEAERKELSMRLEEERRKVEDLQFSVEEATINIDEKELLSEESICAVERAHDLEKQLQAETERNKALDEKLDNIKAQYTEYKAKAKDAEDTSVAYLDQIEELTHKLTMAETQIRDNEAARASQGRQSSEYMEELNAKNQQITQLERHLDEKERAVTEFKVRLGELDEEVGEKVDKTQKLQDTIDELMQKLAVSDTQASNLSGEVQQLRGQLADVQRQLEANEDKTQQLENEKQQLEGQLQDSLKLSGEGSEHLHLMNEQLLEKDRKLQELKAAMSDSTREVGKLRRELEAQRSQTERETETLLSKHGEDLRGAGRQVEEKEAEISKLQGKLEKLRDQQREERESLSSKKESDIAEVRREVERREEQLTGARKEAEEERQKRGEIQQERDEVKFEKEKLSKQLKSSEQEHQAVCAQLEQVKGQQEKAEHEREKVLSQQKSLEEKLAVIEREKQALSGENNKISQERDSLQKSKADLEDQLSRIRQESSSVSSEQEHLSQRISELQAQVTSLSAERDQYKAEVDQSKESLSQGAQDLASLQEQVTSQQTQFTDLSRRVEVVSTERDALRLQVNTLKAKEEERQLMEAQKEDIKTQMEALRVSSSQMRDEFDAEKQTLQSSLSAAKTEAERREGEMDQLKTQLAHLQGENLSLNTFKSTIQGLEVDKVSLQQRVTQLETALTESQQNANILAQHGGSTDPGSTKISEDNQVDDGQVAFLNSVIVDMQTKNEELKQRLIAMETGTVNGADDSYEINDNVRKKPAPRLFCDICDVFDQHDTEDCPKQAMEEEGSAGTQHHGNRGEERPYCVICEEFGHSTDNCDDEQTF